MSEEIKEVSKEDAQENSKQESSSENTTELKVNKSDGVYEKTDIRTEKGINLADEGLDRSAIKPSAIYPSVNYNKYTEYIQRMIDLFTEVRDEEDKVKIKSILKELDPDLYELNKNSRDNAVRRDGLHDPEQVPNMVNGVKYGDKELVTRTVEFSNKESISHATAIAKFNSFLGIGDVIQVPLWHSGFWVTLRPIKQKDFINLLIALRSYAVDMGRYSNALIYSNYTVISNRIILDFIKDNIVDTSLKLNQGDDIRQYIKIQDINILVNGLIASMHPKGYNIIRTCSNSLILDKDNKANCDYTEQVNIDPKKILWVNKKKLDDKMLSHMAVRRSGGVTKEEVEHYQSKILSRDSDRNILKLELDNDKYIYIKLKIPNVLDYVTIGEQWVDNLIKDFEETVAGKDSKEIKNQRILDYVYVSKIGLYNSYIAEIKTSEGDVYDTPSKLADMMDVLSGEYKLSNKFLESIGKYITESSIAIIATPNFTCPKCKKDQHQDNVYDGFEDLIPLNVIELFFELSDIRQEQMRE